jgi:hypothetical protein
MGQHKKGEAYRSAQFEIGGYLDQVIKGIGERNSGLFVGLWGGDVPVELR